MKFNIGLFFKEALLFSLTFSLAITSASLILRESISIRQLSFGWSDLAAVVVGVIFIAALFKFGLAQRKGFRIIAAVVVFGGSTISVGFLYGLIGAISFLMIKRVWMHNLAMITTIAGIGAAIGLQFEPIVIVFAIAIMSFYDIYAVYRSGHMVRMARQMIESDSFFGFIIPRHWHGFSVRIEQAKARFGEDYMLLGSGDTVFPLMLICAVLRRSLESSLIVAGSAMIGLFATHLLFANQKTKRPMAALPPIGTATILGYLLTTVL